MGTKESTGIFKALPNDWCTVRGRSSFSGGLKSVQPSGTGEETFHIRKVETKIDFTRRSTRKKTGISKKKSSNIDFQTQILMRFPKFLIH